MKNLGRRMCIAVIVLLTVYPVCRADERDEDFDKQIAAVLVECQKITPGMTRADLLKVFVTEGGHSTATHRTFAYRSCPYIQVDVEFKISDPHKTLEEHSTDVISRISKPYLALSVAD